MDSFDARYTNAYVVTDDQGRDFVKSETFDVKCVQVFPPQQMGVVNVLCWIQAGTKYHVSSEVWSEKIDNTAYGPMNMRVRKYIESQVVSNGEWLTTDVKKLVPVFPKKSRKFL